MGHFNEQYITDCDLRTSDDDYLDRRDGVSSAPSILRNPDITFDHAQQLAASAARLTMNTWHVLDDQGHYLIADDLDAAAWGDRVVWSVEPEQAFSAAEMDGPPFDDPLPDDAPGQDIDGVPYP